jgi:hypothetical protein
MNRHHGQSGTVLLEFSLVLLWLMFLILSVIGLPLYFRAMSAAQAAAVAGLQMGIFCSGAATWSRDEEAQLAAREVLGRFGVAGSADAPPFLTGESGRGALLRMEVVFDQPLPVPFLGQFSSLPVRAVAVGVADKDQSSSPGACERIAR